MRELKNIVSTDDFAGPLANQTNLALKAILGIRAMGEIASVTGNTKDAKEFIKTSKEYMTKWEKYTFDEDSTHAKLAYQLSDSWGFYLLFLLGLISRFLV